MHNYFLIGHNYSHYVIYNFKPELKIWKNYNVVKINFFTDFDFMNYYIIIILLKFLGLIIYDKYVIVILQYENYEN